MTKLTTEITIEELQYRINAHENDLTQMWTADYFLNVQKELLALKQAAKNPVAYRNKFTGQFFTLEQQPDAATDAVVYEPVFLAAPALPKQPELVESLKKVMNSWLAMEPKLAFQPEFTDVMMLLDAEPAPAQPVIPEEKSAIHRTKEPEDIAFNNGFAAGWNCCRSEVISLNETTAQPVSEPYKLISVKDDTPTESGDYWCYLGKDFESPTKYRVVHFDVRHHEFQDHRVTHWMRLPAEPEQEA